MKLGIGNKVLRVMTAVMTTVSITIVSCTAPTTPPPAGGQGPQFVINSPLDGGFTAGTFFFSVQPFDPSSVQKVDFEVDGVAVGSDSTADDGFRVAIAASDYDAAEIVLRATVTGKDGRTRSGSVTVENVPVPPSSGTVGSDGLVLGTVTGSTVAIRPGDAVGANVSVAEQTQAEVKATTGIDYAALGVTFLGAQEIDSDKVIEEPLMVSSADFADRVQPGQAIVNYMITPDLDGDGVGELVVVNSASVAGDDVISDPVPALQLGDTTVTGQTGASSFVTQQEGITGRPGDLVEIEVTGFNPVSSSSNRVVWTSLENGKVVEAAGKAGSSADGTGQILTFGVPVLPAGLATVVLSNLNTGAALEPIEVTILAASPLVGSAEDAIDGFLETLITFVAGLPEEGPASAEAKADAIDELMAVRQDFTILFSDLATDPNPELEAVLEDFALLVQNPVVFSSSNSGFSSQALSASEKKKLNWSSWGLGAGAFAAGAYVGVAAGGCVVAFVVCGIALGLGLAAIAIQGYVLAEDERPGCPSLISELAQDLGLTGMGSALPSGGSGCGSASGGGSGSSLRSQQAGTSPILIKVFVGGDPLPFTGVADAGGYFYIPIIPEGEPFTAIATDTGTDEVRTAEGIGPALGESVYMFFDFDSDENSLPTIPINANTTGALELDETDLYTFVGSTGQLITIGTQGDPDFVEQYKLDLFGPASSTDLAPAVGNGRFYSETGVVALPNSGVYTLSVASNFSASGSGSGTYHVGLSEIAEPGPIDISSSPATMTGEQNVYGDRHFFSFDAQAGDLHKFSLTLPDGSLFNANLNLLGPGPEPFYDRPNLIGSGTFVLDTKPIAVTAPFLVPESGEYLVEIERGGSSGTLEVSLGAWEFAVLTPDPATAITIGDTVTDDIGLPGEIDLFTFTATAGQMVDFSTDSVATEVNQVNWSVSAPDGSEIFDAPLFSDPGTFTLVQAGTYTVMVGSDNDAGTGAYTLTLVNAP